MIIKHITQDYNYHANPDTKVFELTNKNTNYSINRNEDNTEAKLMIINNDNLVAVIHANRSLDLIDYLFAHGIYNYTRLYSY